jgi:hypothetical protein
LDHPVVKHAAALFADGDTAIRREGISGLKDPMWWKLKTGRWRGAIWVDSEGQAWVGAAGLRRKGDRDDFYESFGKNVTATGAERYLPTEEDYARLACEKQARLLDGWDKDLQVQALDACREALVDGKATFTVPALTPGRAPVAAVVVEVVAEEWDGEPDHEGKLISVVVERRDWQTVRLVHHAERIVLAVMCRDPQRWEPHYGPDRDLFLVSATGSEIEQWVHDDQTLARLPGETDPNQTAHRVHRERLTLQYVEGSAARALCGAVFVPTRDPEGLPLCPTCQAIWDGLPQS